MTEPVDSAPAAVVGAVAGLGADDPENGAAPRPAVAVGSGLAVAASSAGGNLLGAAITVVLAHTYSGAHFGALAALLAVGLVATVPATGMQYVIARRTAQAGLADHEHDRTALRFALLLGAGIGLLICAAGPLFAAFLDVPVAAVVVVGATVLPYTVNSAQLGSLLARPRLVRFAIGQLLLALLRFAGVAVACVLHAGVVGVLVGLLVATAAAALCGAALTGWRGWSVSLPGERVFAHDIVRAALDLAGISVLMNLDLLLARHYLSAADSGVYALGALFAKAGLWAAQFVPQVIFARLARAERRRRLLLGAVALDIGVGAVVLAAAVLLARPALRIVSADADPVAAARLAPVFALLGVAWAICYLVLLAAVATQDRGPSRMLWCAAVVEVALVVGVRHGSAAQILTTATAGTVLLAGAVVWWSARRPAVSPPG